MAIRRHPEDFLVEELLDPSFAKSINPAPPPADRARELHAVYLLTKTSLTTPDAVAALARACRTAPGHIDYAGLKDRHARTSQHASIPLARLPRAFAPQTVGGKNWSARLAGFSPAPALAPSIRGNRFTITLRSLTPAAIAEAHRRAALLSTLSPPGERVVPTKSGPGDGSPRLLILNYFGDQRFGSGRHGQGFIARRLIEGDFEGALRLAIATPARKDHGATRTFTRLAAEKWGDWPTLARALPRTPERRAIESLARGGDFREAFAALPYFLQSMSVEAFQSHLWNDAARRIADQIAHESAAHTPARPDDRAENRAAAPDSAPLRTRGLYADMLFPTAAMLDRADAARAVGGKWREAVMPVPAPKTEPSPPWGDALTAALRAENLTPADLRIPNLRRPFFGEAPRPLFIEAANFTLTPTPNDTSALTTSFDLPRGAYATVVLRALGQ